MPKLLLCAALLAVSPAAVAGEIRGRLLIERRPAAGVAITAAPYETPNEVAGRESRRAAPPPAIASVVSRVDGSFVLAITEGPSVGRGQVRVIVEGAGIVPFELPGIYDPLEFTDVGDQAVRRGRPVAGRVVDAKGGPIAGAEVRLYANDLGAGPVSSGRRAVAQLALTGLDGGFRFDQATESDNLLRVDVLGFAPTEVGGLREGALTRPIVLQEARIVSGFVRLSDGKTAAAAVLVRFEGKAHSRWTESLPDGSFRLSDVPVESGTVVVDGGDRGFGEVRGVRVAEPGMRGLQVVLVRPGSLEGRIVDARSGVPVPRVRVMVRDGAFVSMAVSGVDGRYRVTSLRPGRYDVEAESIAHVPYVRDAVLVLAGETQRMDMPLTLGASIAGRVVDDSGASIPFARIVLLGGTDDRRSRQMPFFSGTDGAFRSSRLTPGEGQRLVVSHAGYQGGSIAGLALEAGRANTGITVILHRGLSLAGIVKDESGNPVPGADVNISQARVFGPRGQSTLLRVNVVGAPGASTDSNGRFEIFGLSPDEYGVVARKHGYSDASRESVTVSAETAPIELTLKTGTSITGIVINPAGIPVDGYSVGVSLPGEDDASIRVVPAGSDGFFQFEGLVPGRAYEIAAFGSHGVETRRHRIVAPADIDLVVPMRSGLSGRVLDTLGTPIADFELEARSDQSTGGQSVTFRRARTDTRAYSAGRVVQFHSEDGAFALEGLAPGKWEINVRAKGYRPSRVGGIGLEAGATKSGVEVRLTHGSSIRGRVLDSQSGRGITGARVDAEQNSSVARGPGEVGADLATWSDADGAFEIDSVSHGRYVIRARHPDYAEAIAAAEVGDESPRVDVRMGAGAFVGGLVLSEQQQPIDGAIVTLSPYGADLRGISSALLGQSVIADAAGRFRIDHLNPGRYRVVASSRERSSTPFDVGLQSGERRDDLVLTLAGGAVVKGWVKGLSQPAESIVLINLTISDYFGNTRAAADGTFAFTGVPPGLGTLLASVVDPQGGSRRNATAHVEVAAGQGVVESDIVFDEGARLSGHVTRAGRPAIDAFVSAFLRSGGRQPVVTRTDVSGYYVMEGLAPGSYEVSAGFGSGVRPQDIELSADAELDLTVPVARLAGSVIDGASGRALADASISLERKGGSHALGASAIHGDEMVTGTLTARTDDDGKFALENIEPGEYSMSAQKAGYQRTTRRVSAAEQASDDLVLALTRGEGIGLVVRDAVFGVELRTVRVLALDGRRAVAFLGPVPLDTDGRGEITSLPRGIYSLLVDAVGYAPTTVRSVAAPAGEVDIVLTPGGAFEIHAGPTTLNKGSASFTILAASGAAHAYSLDAPTGRLDLTPEVPLKRVRNFAPGEYILITRGTTGRQPFTVAEGRLTRIDLP